MNDLMHIESLGYGIAIVSVSGFEKLRKSHKIRHKKMLSLFDSSPTTFHEFTREGTFIPIPHINMSDYVIDILMDGDEVSLADWQILGEWDRFYLDAREGPIGVLSFEAMQEWNHSMYLSQDTLPSSYILDDQLVESNKGIRLSLAQGIYALKITGVKSLDHSRQYTGEYGFFLHFTPVDKIPSSYIRDLSEIDYRSMFDKGA